MARLWITGLLLTVACGDDLPSPSEIRAELTGMPLDEFYEESFRHILRREPEWVTSMGLDEELGLPGDQLDNLSLEFTRESWRVNRVILTLLNEQYDRDLLPADERVDYDTYQWYLDDIHRSGPYRRHWYLVTQMLGSPHAYTPFFMTEIHPVTDKKEAEAYITRLRAIDEKLDQVHEHLEDSADHGIIPPRYVVDIARNQARSIASTPGAQHELCTVFRTKLESARGLNADDRRNLGNDCISAVDDEVRPGYDELAERLADLAIRATNFDGVGNLPDGGSYYAYQLRHSTTTDLDAQTIHDMGVRELERIQAEMRSRFDALGYPSGDSIPQLYRRLIVDDGEVSGNAVLATYTDIIRTAEANLDDALDIRPSSDVAVIGDPHAGGYYTSPSFDGSRPGAFYANVSGNPEPRYAMRSLAYHEAVPGHHTQIGIAVDLTGQPLFRRAISFTAYAEGWALYAEWLAWDLGWYSSDRAGDLGRLQWEALRAARLVIDTGIHALGWSHQQAVEYLEDNVGFDSRTLWAPGQVTRYVAWPGQATAYMVGMLHMKDLRASAEERLGANFDLIEFHRTVLGRGSVPLGVLTNLVNDM